MIATIQVFLCILAGICVRKLNLGSTDVIAGNAMADDTAEDKQSCVDRNVEHLELMKAKDYWTSESMTAVDSAISAGKGYTA